MQAMSDRQSKRGLLLTREFCRAEQHIKQKYSDRIIPIGMSRLAVSMVDMMSIWQRHWTL